MSEQVWIPTTWAHVHTGATVRPPEFPDAVSLATSVVAQQRSHPVPHSIVKVILADSGVESRYDFDPGADVEILIDIPTAGALAVLAAAGLAPQVISEYEEP